MNRPLLIIAAILGLFVLLETTSRLKPGLSGSSAGNEAIERGGSAGAFKPIPAPKRANSLGFDENSPDAGRLSCLQLQVIDEIDLLGDTECK